MSCGSLGARFTRGLLLTLGPLPFLPALLGRWAHVPPVSWLGAWFEFQCQQAPARLAPGAAVCTRCLGLYVGLALGALLLRPRLRPALMRVWVGFASLLMLLDVASEQLDLRGPHPLFRLLTGLLLAFPVGVALVLAARGLEAHHQAE